MNKEQYYKTTIYVLISEANIITKIHLKISLIMQSTENQI